MKKISLAVLLTLLSANALADEKNMWDGFYGSVLIGYTDGEVKENNSFITYRPSGGDYVGYGSQNSSLSGVSGNLKFGFNKQIANNNVFGLEIGATIQNADSNNRVIDAYSDPDGSNLNDAYDPVAPLMAKTKVNHYETLSFRFGHLLKEETLVYALAGVAIGKIERKLTQYGQTNWFDLGYSTTRKSTEAGYVVGLGVEHKINAQLALRASYEYVDFGRINMDYLGPNTFDIVTINQPHKIDFSNLTVGLSYQF